MLGKNLYMLESEVVVVGGGRVRGRKRVKGEI